jgi:DNA replication and repair protein RecF
MTVENIHLWCFRNHRETEISFYHQSNVLVGKNGQGKTNILEALSYLCLTKSFFGAQDATVLMIGEPSFKVEGSFTLGSGRTATICAAFTAATNEKSITVNNLALEKRSDHIGKFPIVILSPEHAAITMGGPAERRRFVDLAIAQSSSVYLADIMEYRRILRQRNSILTEAKARRTQTPESINAWNESLLRYAAGIIHRRRIFLEQFSERVITAYRTLAGAGETPRIEYIPDRKGKNIDEIRSELERELIEKQNDEIRIGTTLVGPHRDEIRFTLNNQEIRKYASQGQHKTYLIALKIAEYESLKELCTETPIVLLDDVFSELDEERTQQLIEQVTGLGQTFITTTENAFITTWISTGHHTTKIEVINGTASYVTI